ncbi:MAG: hypothetical protein AAF550_08980, partial [Myxococcota bacterium]
DLPPSDGRSGSDQGKIKILLGVGFGCLGLCLLSAVALWVLGSRGIASIEESHSRLALTSSLSRILTACTTDPSGAGAENLFHPSVAQRYQPIICTVTAETLEAFGDHQRSQIVPGDDGRAVELGISSDSCFLATSGAAKIIGCQIDDSTEAVSLQLIHLESPTEVR